MSGAQQPRLAQESIAGMRPHQEDAVVIDTLSDGRTLVAVADGMGGHAAGEVASGLALETLVEALQEGQALDQAFHLANQSVHDKAKEPGKEGMGTTLVAMVLGEDSYRIANVGDSRAYLLSGDGIRRITEDHSFVAEAVKRGQSESEAVTSLWRDVLTRAIGTDAEVEVDLFGPFSVEDDTAVLLCSDGLYKTLSDSDLGDLFAKSGGPRGAAQALVAAAYERGSDDNISIAIAEFGEVPRDRPAGTVALEWTPPDDGEAGAGSERAVTTSERDEPGVASAKVATRTGPPMGVIGAAVVVMLAVIAYLIRA